jgi:DNA-binding NarL/FixJ family response regulator
MKKHIVKPTTAERSVPADASAPPVRVAIVEDDAGLREALETFVNRTRDLRCVAAYGSAEAALKGLVAVAPDVVLMDIRLPGISGIECVRQLRVLVPQAKALMLTAFGEDDDVFQSLAAGAYGYLLKSAQPARISEAIREVHLGGSPLSGNIARKIVEHLRPAEPAVPAGGADPVSELSPRELEVLRHLAAGLSYKQIATQFDGSINTVRTHIKRIYDKLHAHSRTEAVRTFQSRGGR